MDTWIQVISSVGFPIAACIGVFWYMIRQDEKHDATIKTLSETIEKNTNVLAELSTLIRTLIK